MDHLKKHLIHGLFLLAMAVAVNAGGLAIGALALVGVVVLSLVMLEAALWLIDRRDRSTDAAS